MHTVILSMSKSYDGHVDSDRQHPGALPEDQELVRWRLDWMKDAAEAHGPQIPLGTGWARAGGTAEDG